MRGGMAEFLVSCCETPLGQIVRFLEFPVASTICENSSTTTQLNP